MILDTNALSAAADGEPAIARVLGRATEIAIPVIVLGEYRYGIAGSRRRNDYAEWLGGFLADSRVLELTETTALAYAEVRLELKRAGTPIPSNDLWIAALGRQHGLPVLTRDQHFDRVADLKRLTW